MKFYETYNPPDETNIPGIIYLPKYPVMDDSALTPCKLFDDLYFVGTTFIGCLILKTTDGLIFIDSLNDRNDVERVILPGMKELGLDPKDIRKILISHGHFDHYGGAAALKEISGCEVLMGEIDCRFMHENPINLPQYSPEYPEIDRFIGGGDVIELGDKKIKVYFTPGHTPGGISFIFPVTDNGKTHMLSLWGGINPPGDIEGCEIYAASAQHFLEESIAEGCDVEFSVHPFVDYSINKMEAIRSRKADEEHPLVIGEEGVSLFMQIVKLTAVQRIQSLKAGQFKL